MMLAPKILVVDDSWTDLTLIATPLREGGFDVITAVDGDEALEKVISERPQCVLLDVVLPKQNGFQVCRKLKEDPSTAEIPVIMVTARDDLDARAEGMRLGVSDFLAKPVFRRQLANRIRAQLDMVATARANDATLHQLQGNSKK